MNNEENEVLSTMAHIVELVAELCNSVRKDVTESNRVISDHTVICHSRVVRKMADLEDAIDRADGIQ